MIMSDIDCLKKNFIMFENICLNNIGCTDQSNNPPMSISSSSSGGGGGASCFTSFFFYSFFYSFAAVVVGAPLEAEPPMEK